MSCISHECTDALINNSEKINESLVIQTMMNYSQDYIFFKDTQSKFLLVSKSLHQRLGLPEETCIIGKSDFDFFPYSYSCKCFEDEKRIIDTEVPIIGKLEKLVWPDAATTWQSCSKYPLYDSLGHIIGTWGISRDMTELKTAEQKLFNANEKLKETNEQLEILSIKDPVSNLYNYRHFYEECEKEFSHCKRQAEKGRTEHFSIILFDVDNFKSINDSHGHLFGDYAIKHVAEILQSMTRSTDKVFRYGGDEFIILLRGTTKKESSFVGEKIRKAVERNPIISDGLRFCITISGGIASSEETNSANELMEKADKRLYKSKKNGKNPIT